MIVLGFDTATMSTTVGLRLPDGDTLIMRDDERMTLKPGEKVLLVDDILRSGQKLAELKKLVESKGGEVVGLAVMIYQPNPTTIDLHSFSSQVQEWR